MRRWLNILCGIVLSMEAAAAFGACSPIPGSDQVWADTSARWIFIGELHGSNEAPAAFADLVCEALEKHRHVTVALERPTSEQMALDEMLTGQDLPEAKRHLLNLPDWKTGMDGRASEAMVRLLLSLRDLRASNPNLSLFAFEAPYTDTPPGARDEAMGHALLALGVAKPHDLILVLTGNVHAMQAPLFGYDFAAMYIPPKERLSLEVTDRGGKSWSNFNGACGPFEGGTGDKGSPKSFGIFLDPSLAPYGKVDGVLALGIPLTSSPPGAGEPSPLPSCRRKFIPEHSSETKS